MSETSITFVSVKRPCELHEKIEEYNIDTLAKMLTYSKMRYGDMKCLGTREVLDEIVEVQQYGNTFKKVKNRHIRK